VYEIAHISRVGGVERKRDAAHQPLSIGECHPPCGTGIVLNVSYLTFHLVQTNIDGASAPEDLHAGGWDYLINMMQMQ